MKKILITLCFVFSGCGDCTISMQPLDGRDRMLVVGDSISIGYTPHLQKLYPDVQVIHNECNGESSRNGKCRIDEWVSHASYWDICTFNHGIWDILLNEEHVPIDEYIENLRYEADVLNVYCGVLIFNNTIKIPANVTYIKKGSEEVYNEAAEKLMGELDIPVCDLYSVSETIPHLRHKDDLQNDVHFSVEGSKVLADKIAECIMEQED